MTFFQQMKSGYDINWKGTVSFSTKGHPYYMNNEGRPLLFVCKLPDVSNERDSDIDMCARQQLQNPTQA
jgi:hypothetical protein